MSVEGWIISSCLAVIAIAFIVIAVFLVRLAITTRRTIKRVDYMVAILDPILERIGFAVEDRLLASMERAEKKRKKKGSEDQREGIMGYAMDAAQIVLLGSALWKKLSNKK